MATDSLLCILEGAPYGAYAVDVNQRIIYWNRGAERILGHQADLVMGRSCCEVTADSAQDDNGPSCEEGCPSFEFFKHDCVPSIRQTCMRSASGQRKPVTLVPMIVPEALPEEKVLVLLFHDLQDAKRVSRATSTVRNVWSGNSPRRYANESVPDQSAVSGSLTTREREVLQSIASGLSAQEISIELRISLHTVLNHSRNIRSKLGAQNRIGAVLTGLRLGLLTIPPESTQAVMMLDSYPEFVDRWT